ncbi:MAG: MFS transporter [Sporocytophaga sp.]|uniref:MFS transporter n=1 Tax=Sporocytophaga sp. TaxID=2231183 RepID=UPI001B0622A4|nr:MFS transporter [Sporocytophaga sp.]MBO9703114.1 MFS transporter [Sporocytophaga sp.]
MSRISQIDTFRAFRNRNYALFFSGQSLSQIGTWMQRTGVSWVVYSTTHSAFMLGLTMFASQFPSFLLSLYGGIISDRYNRYKILLFTQAASMVQAILLAILTLSGHYTISGIIMLSVFLGIINAFDVPARQPLVHEMVHDKADLPNALALNSSMVNFAKLIGPALSGIVLQKFGAGICFSINAISFVAVICSLLWMKLPEYKIQPSGKKLFTELSEGFTYIKETPTISSVILMLTSASLLVLPYDTLIPVFAKTVFNGDVRTFGYISSFIGVGALVGTIFLASLKKGIDLKRILFINTIVLGIGLLLFSRITYFPVAMACAVLCGFGAMSQTTICITIVQIHTASHMRGRVMSFIALGFFGMMPLGSLLIGTISQQTGAPTAILCQGILAIVIAIIFSGKLKKNKLPPKANVNPEETITEQL